MRTLRATAVSSEVTIQFLDAFGDAWNGHDVGDIMTFMADDCAFETSSYFRTRLG